MPAKVRPAISLRAMSSDEAKTTRAILLEAIEANPGVTEKQLGEITGFSTSKVTPNRIRLWEAGEIEPTTETGWRKAMVSRLKGVGWHVVEPERRDEVRQRAQTRRKRNAKSAEERARRAVEDLADPVVFRLYQQMMRDDPAKTQAGQRRRERVLRDREIEAEREAKRAKEDGQANADIKKKIALLWKARATVAAIDRHLLRERARVAEGGMQVISTADWMVVLRDVALILESMGSIWWNVRDLGDDLVCPVCGSAQKDHERHLMPFAVDAEAEEIDASGEDNAIVPDAEVVDT
ncbi:MAG TPA: hypothetical protein VFR97_13220 [Capillimicrobium sp.]|nr:hypothetical protein [Capillimicrobium sp.]